mgnify:CR=1 FL=1
MSKDDMETNTMNVVFNGSDEKDDKDGEEFKVRGDKDDNNTIYRFARCINSR